MASDDCSTIAFTLAISAWSSFIAVTECSTRRPMNPNTTSAISVATMVIIMPRSPVACASSERVVLCSSSTSLRVSCASRKASIGATAAR